MQNNTSNFDFKDRVLLELKCIIGAFGLIRSLDPDKIVENDLEMFGNGMAWRTEFLLNELEEYFFSLRDKGKNQEK